MRARFDPGHRYRLHCKVPRAIDPRLVLQAMQRDVCHVALSDVVRGVVAVELTWRGAARVIDSEFIIDQLIIDLPPVPSAA